MCLNEESCRYTFDPQSWDKGINGASTKLEETWLCPHDQHGDSDYCIFHQAEDADTGEVSGAAQREAFLDAITQPDADKKKFIGATFESFDFSGELLDLRDNHVIELRQSTFKDGVQLEGTRLTSAIRFDNSRFESASNLSDATFEQDVYFYGCKFESPLSAKGANFEGEAIFSRSVFHRTAQFSSSNFGRKTVFTHCRFEGPAKFWSCHFDGRAYFRDVEFLWSAEFTKLTTTDRITFADSTFDLNKDRGYSPDFKYSRFNGPVHFGADDIQDKYGAVTFVDRPEFVDAKFDDTVDFVETVFHAGADFSDTRWSDLINFSEIAVEDELTFTASEFDTALEFAPSTASTEGDYVDFRDAMVNSGRIAQPAEGQLYFDFEEGTIGDVVFEANDITRPLDNVRLLQTSYENFDFMRYRPDLESDWKIHTFPPTFAHDSDREHTPVELELTYLRAKSGANEIGDNRSASGFFRREMRARGLRFKQQIDEASTLRKKGRSRSRYAFNWLFDKFCHYGESPRRTLLSALSVILLFSGLYALAFPATNSPPPYPDAPWNGYLLFSAESFVALVNNPSATLSAWPLRVLSVFEGFLGALFIALFLFTLTRYVHR